MHNYIKRTFLLITILLITSCVSIGNKIQASALEKIRIGETTKTEMIKTFGMPQSQLFVSENGLTMIWQYIYMGPFGVSTEQQNLAVLFDENEKVRKFNLLDSTSEEAKNYSN